MIEDCPDNIESIKEVTNVIAYSNSYNQNISNEITKVNGFYEIYGNGVLYYENQISI